MNTEKFANNATTTLNGGINNSVTSLDVGDASLFPATGNFRIKIEDEIMLVTAVSSNTFTVVRAQEGTAGASHADTEDVLQVLTAEALLTWARDNVALWGNSLPLGSITDETGDVLVASDFTEINGGSETITDVNGTLMIRKDAQGASHNTTSYVLTAPATPYSAIAALSIVAPTSGTGSESSMSLMFRESGTSKFSGIFLSGQASSTSFPQTFAVWHFTSETVFGSQLVSVRVFTLRAPVVWFKITDNGTNLLYYMSDNGIDWIQVLSQSRTANMAGGPNQVGFTINNYNNADFEMIGRVHHFSLIV